MTMEEWLRSQRENAEIFGAAAKERGAEAEKAYYDGMMEAIDALLSNLPEFEHEVTLREVVAFCQKRFEGIDSPKCKGCSLWSTTDDCCLVYQPYWIPVSEIQKRMKEARK